MHGDVLPGAFAVVFDAHTQTDGLGFSGDECGDVGAGDAEIFREIAADTVKGDLRLGLLFVEVFERGQCGAVGDGLPVGFLEVGDDNDFARGIGRVLQCRGGSLEGIIRSQRAGHGGHFAELLGHEIEVRGGLIEQFARCAAGENDLRTGAVRQISEHGLHVLACLLHDGASGKRGLCGGCTHGEGIVQHDDE